MVQLPSGLKRYNESTGKSISSSAETNDFTSFGAAPGGRIGNTLIQKDHIVYVVEDDTSLRNAVHRLLKCAQYRVLAFASAEEFYSSDFKSSRGCLLLDIRLPGLSGFELQEQLLAAGTQMPVIFLTGQDRAGMEEHAMRLGASAYLRKPVDEDTLLGAIQLAMESLTIG